MTTNLKQAWPHFVGARYCFWDDDFKAPWRSMNDRQKRQQFDKCHCGGTMVEVTHLKSRYLRCEHYVGCLKPSTQEFTSCDCGAPFHLAISLADFRDKPMSVVECDTHDWEYEERFVGDYEGPALMAPYGDRRTCRRCARPEVLKIDTAPQEEFIYGVGRVLTRIYKREKLARLLRPWELDDRRVHKCKECDSRWYQSWRGSTEYVCPSCGAWSGGAASGYPVGTTPPPAWTIIGTPA